MSKQLRVTGDDGQKLKIPEFAKTDDYQRLLAGIIEKASDGEKLKISEFAQTTSVDIRTLYRWLQHEHTKKEIDNYIEAMVTQDKTSVYQTVVENKTNPHFSRLFLDYYERRSPGKGGNVGNITINLGFFNAPQTQTDPIEDAQITEIIDDSPSE